MVALSPWSGLSSPFRLTRSARFRFQRTAHWADATLAPRNLSRRSRHCCRFNLLLASIDSLRALPASQDSPLDYRFLRSPQPQSSQTASRGRFSPLLVSNDSLTSFSPAVNAPLGHHFLHYPQPQLSHCSLGAVALLVSVDSFGSLPLSADSPLG